MLRRRKMLGQAAVKAPPKGRRQRDFVPPAVGIGSPAHDAHKGHCRNLSLAEAVAECAALSALLRPFIHHNAVMVSLKDILRTLREKKIPFVLTGAHGIAAWTGRPRATQDVDILVRAGRNHARAVKALKELYPNLETKNFAGVVGFFAAGEKYSLIDVTFPHRPDQVETLRTAIWTVHEGERCRVPTLETALANKYGAMLTLTREIQKRAMDAIDFAWMVKHATDPEREPIDQSLLAELGEKVWPDGGGREIVHLVELVLAGKIIPTPLDSPPGRTQRE